MSAIDKKLTDEQKTAIRVAFTTHNIKIPEQRFQQLLSHVEQNMMWWEDYKRREEREAIGRTEMTAEIKHLRKTLKKLNPSTKEVLARFYTIAHPQKTRKRNMIADLFSDNYFQAAHAFEILAEACDKAIEGKGVDFDGSNPVDVYTKKAGRPYNNTDRNLISNLGRWYEKATGKRPGETPDGPFDDFLAAVFNAIDPRRERGDFRKLIRTSYRPGNKL